MGTESPCVVNLHHILKQFKLLLSERHPLKEHVATKRDHAGQAAGLTALVPSLALVL